MGLADMNGMVAPEPIVRRKGGPSPEAPVPVDQVRMPDDPGVHARSPLPLPGYEADKDSQPSGRMIWCEGFAVGWVAGLVLALLGLATFFIF